MERRCGANSTTTSKDLIAFAIMKKAQLQFHKGNHRNKGAKPEECYIEEVQRLLDEIDTYVVAASAYCDKTKVYARSRWPRRRRGRRAAPAPSLSPAPAARPAGSREAKPRSMGAGSA